MSKVTRRPEDGPVLTARFNLMYNCRYILVLPKIIVMINLVLRVQTI